MDIRLWLALALLLASGSLGCKKNEGTQGVAGAGVAGTGVIGTSGIGPVAGTGVQATAGTSATGTGGAGAAGMDAAPGTFSYLFKNVIVAVGCNGGTLCHATAAATTLSLNNRDTAYMSLVNVAAMGKNLVKGKGPDCKDSGLIRVVPGNPDQSLMMLKVQGKQPCGDPMPPTSPLAADKVQLIHDWIAAGAKND
jgi:hypothetical protein